jgi:hypothetical protein
VAALVAAVVVVVQGGMGEDVTYQSAPASGRAEAALLAAAAEAKEVGAIVVVGCRMESVAVEQELWGQVIWEAACGGRRAANWTNCEGQACVRKRRRTEAVGSRRAQLGEAGWGQRQEHTGAGG